MNGVGGEKGGGGQSGEGAKRFITELANGEQPDKLKLILTPLLQRTQPRGIN